MIFFSDYQFTFLANMAELDFLVGLSKRYTSHFEIQLLKWAIGEGI